MLQSVRYGLVVVAELLRSFVSFQLFKQRVEEAAKEIWDADGVYVML
jgi:hypothetical protein